MTILELLSDYLDSEAESFELDPVEDDDTGETSWQASCGNTVAHAATPFQATAELVRQLGLE